MCARPRQCGAAACESARSQSDAQPQTHHCGRKNPLLELSFQVRFATQRETCRIKEWPNVQTRYETRIAPTGVKEFRVEIHLDKYFPGNCDWQADEVMLCPSNHRAEGRAFNCGEG